MRGLRSDKVSFNSRTHHTRKATQPTVFLGIKRRETVSEDSIKQHIQSPHTQALLHVRGLYHYHCVYFIKICNTSEEIPSFLFHTTSDRQITPLLRCPGTGVDPPSAQGAPHSHCGTADSRDSPLSWTPPGVSKVRCNASSWALSPTPSPGMDTEAILTCVLVAGSRSRGMEGLRSALLCVC